MIPAERLGELKDRAAGLVALAELLSSRRIGPKAIAAALPPASEACSGVVAAASSLAPIVIAAAGDDTAARAELHATFERAVASVRALEADLRSVDAPESARARLILERSAQEARSHVSAALFAADMFAAATSPRTVSIRVADVLGFGPALADGPHILRATLDAQPGPVATIDARLLRALVELSLQIVAAAGTSSPHVQILSGAGGTARLLVGARPSAPPAPARRGSRSERSEAPMLAVRRLPWPAEAVHLARAAAALGGASVILHPGGRGLTLQFS